MLDVWLYPALDTIFYPLLWMPPGLSLSIVSFLTGVLMIWLYWLTSDQWRMAHEKRRIKVAQNELMRGDYSWQTIRRLLGGNLNLTVTALVPAVVTVALILVMIPWVGSRFGYYVPDQRKPLTMTVRADQNWTLEVSNVVRTSVLERTDESGVLVRFMGLEAGRHRVTFRFEPGDSVDVPVSVGTPGPVWPDLSRPRWYHRLVRPAGFTLPPDGPLQAIEIGYTPVFGFLGFVFFGTYLPGWLTYFFVFSFFVGIYFKFRYSVE